MPDTAKILRFPARDVPVLSTREEVSGRAKSFLETPQGDRTPECVDAALADGDVLTSVFSTLWDLINSSPAVVAEEAPAIYRWVSARTEKDFFFDERDFFLGESALLAAGSLRLIGKREETERWLDRAEAGFRHTVAPAAHLARASYIRLTLRYDMRRHEDLLEIIPSVALTFEKLGMVSDLAKCRFLEAMSLKELGRVDEAVSMLEHLVSGEEYAVGAGLAGMALVNLGDLRSTQGLYEASLAAYAKAAPLLRSENRFSAIADLKLMIAVTLRRTGHLEASLQAYREAIQGHADLGMSTRVAYERVLFAEALIEAGRVREAEWEILAALPTIDEQGMVPEGFAAVSLLRDSVRQRKTDPKALLDLREYLQAKN